MQQDMAKLRTALYRNNLQIKTHSLKFEKHVADDLYPSSVSDLKFAFTGKLDFWYF